MEIAVPLKSLSNFWRILETELINCETFILLTWFENCVLGATTFVITDTKPPNPGVTLSTQDNSKLLKQHKNGF